MTREEVKRRLLNIERRTPIHTRKDARDFEALEMAIKALSQEPKSPCDVCRFNPPSSTDGKPCTMCPAERRAR